MDWVHVLVMAAVLGPLYYIAHLERARLREPRDAQRFGAAVERDAVQLDDTADVIGYYDGCEIRAAVRYMGVRYRFESVVPASYRSRVRAGELYVEPGLLYVPDMTPADHARAPSPS